MIMSAMFPGLPVRLGGLRADGREPERGERGAGRGALSGPPAERRPAGAIRPTAAAEAGSEQGQFLFCWREECGFGQLFHSRDREGGGEIRKWESGRGRCIRTWTGAALVAFRREPQGWYE